MMINFTLKSGIKQLFIILTSIFCIVNIGYAQLHKVSWYGGSFHGKKTANGETYNMNAMTTASNTHKMGTKLLVTNPKNNKSVIVKVNDTGGFAKYGRTLDLSKGAFAKIADLNSGTCNVHIKILK